MSNSYASLASLRGSGCYLFDFTELLPSRKVFRDVSDTDHDRILLHYAILSAPFSSIAGRGFDLQVSDLPVESACIDTEITGGTFPVAVIAA